MIPLTFSDILIVILPTSLFLLYLPPLKGPPFSHFLCQIPVLLFVFARLPSCFVFTSYLSQKCPPPFVEHSTGSPIELGSYWSKEDRYFYCCSGDSKTGPKMLCSMRMETTVNHGFHFKSMAIFLVLSAF